MVQVVLNNNRMGQISEANLQVYLAVSNATIISRNVTTIVLKG